MWNLTLTKPRFSKVYLTCWRRRKARPNSAVTWKSFKEWKVWSRYWVVPFLWHENLHKFSVSLGNCLLHNTCLILSQKIIFIMFNIYRIYNFLNFILSFSSKLLGLIWCTTQHIPFYPSHYQFLLPEMITEVQYCHKLKSNSAVKFLIFCVTVRERRPMCSYHLSIWRQ